jgi:hypothetical protein
MKRALAVLLAITFLSLTAAAAKKPLPRPHVVSKRVSKRASSKRGRSKKGGFAKGHTVKRKGAKPTKRARR